MQNKEQKETNFQLEAQLLINRFYELETDGKKMDYDIAVECAKIASKTIIESGGVCLPEDRLYWKCVLKQCDLLHSQEYLMESLKRDEKIYSHADESGAQGTQGVDGISDEALKNAVPLHEVKSIDIRSTPTEMNWYLCRLKDDTLALCYWYGGGWQSINYEKLSRDMVKRWIDLSSVPKFVGTALPI